jgi:hypothetical protein
VNTSELSRLLDKSDGDLCLFFLPRNEPLAAAEALITCDLSKLPPSFSALAFRRCAV